MDIEYVDTVPERRSHQLQSQGDWAPLYAEIRSAPEGAILRVGAASSSGAHSLYHCLYRAMRKGHIPSVGVYVRGTAIYIDRHKAE